MTKAKGLCYDINNLGELKKEHISRWNCSEIYKNYLCEKREKGVY